MDRIWITMASNQEREMMTEEEKLNRLRIKLPVKYHAPLKKQGVSWSVFTEREFDLNQAVSNIQYNTEKMQPRLVKKSEQITDFMEVMETPFLKPYIYIISGKPNDVRACCIAASLLIQASIVHNQMRDDPSQPNSHYGHLHQPQWVKLSNDFKDNLHNPNWKPSFIVLSNITPQSSNLKYEKVRDMLEMYDSIPRIVVCNDLDPLQYANHKFNIKPDYVMYLEEGKKRVEV